MLIFDYVFIMNPLSGISNYVMNKGFWVLKPIKPLTIVAIVLIYAIISLVSHLVLNIGKQQRSEHKLKAN